jgi:hypothetical protein
MVIDGECLPPFKSVLAFDHAAIVARIDAVFPQGFLNAFSGYRCI